MIKITMTAPRTTIHLETWVPAIDVFPVNHSITFLPDRLLARSDRPKIYSLMRLIVGGYALADSHVAGSASLGVETFHARSTPTHALFCCR